MISQIGDILSSTRFVRSEEKKEFKILDVKQCCRPGADVRDNAAGQGRM